MRKLFIAILLIIFIAFWVAFGFNFLGFRDIVTGFFINILGPTAYGFIASITDGILSVIGLGGLICVTGIFFMIGGVFAHYLWVKADWSLRSWGAQRTAKDLGATPVVLGTSSTTPVGATTRPTPQTVAQQTAATTPTTNPTTKAEEQPQTEAK